VRYTPALEAWQLQKQLHEGYGHRFGEPVRGDFTFCGTTFTAECLRCGRRLIVSGGWGGPMAFGPCALTDCAGCGAAGGGPDNLGDNANITRGTLSLTQPERAR
jgi:hypothetical protein